MLEINKLNVYYGSGPGSHHAVRNVSLKIAAGEIVSLVGESGSGKSSVGLAVGMLLSGVHTRLEGEICFDSENVSAMNDKTLRRYRKHALAYIFQEPAVSLNPVFTIGSQIAEVLDSSESSRVNQYLRDVQLSDPDRVACSYPHELSGGMKQRAMIAMALAKKPRLLVADEPTTALDVTVQKEILKLLMDLNRRMNLNILFITHDLNVAAAISGRILIMNRGEIVEEIQDPRNIRLEKEYSKALFKSSRLDREPKTMIEI